MKSMREWLQEREQKTLSEVAPPGMSGTVAAMKQKHPELSKGKTKDGKKKNPYALAWHLKNKGAESHYKEQPNKDSRDPTPAKKKKDKKHKKSKKVKKFGEWTMDREHPEEMLMYEDTAQAFGLNMDQVKSMSYDQLADFFSQKKLSSPMIRAIRLKRRCGQGVRS